LIIGAPLYGVVTTYLFNREYVENTIKNILTIPVSRVSFIMSKTLLLFMWIMMLTMIAWFLTLFLGLLTQFDGLDISLLVRSEEHTSELQSRFDLVCRLLLENKNMIR